MGWNWSLHFCQRAVSHTIAKATGDRLVEDREAGIVLDDHCPTCVAGYVDNFAVIGIDKKKVDEKLEAMRLACQAAGLPVHELEPASSYGEFIGLEFDNSRVFVKAKRLWRLKLALRAVLRRGRASGKMLEILTGHTTWIMLIR